MNRENRIEAISFDLKQAIDDILHELKGLAEDVKRLKEKAGLK